MSDQPPSKTTALVPAVCGLYGKESVWKSGDPRPRILIIGGGVAGITAATQLAPIYQVCVIDCKEYFENASFVFQSVADPEKHDATTILLSDLANQIGFCFLQREVVAIDGDALTATVVVPWTQLLFGLGQEVRAKGSRIGKIIKVDEKDDLPYKIQFSDDQVPQEDWFRGEDVASLEAGAQNSSESQPYENGQINFDYCIVAVGCGHNPFHRAGESLWSPSVRKSQLAETDWPQIDERCLADRVFHIRQIHEELRTLAARGSQVLIVGAGFLGVECACEIADNFPNIGVTIVDALPRCLGPLPDSAAAHASRAMSAKRIKQYYRVKYNPKDPSFFPSIGLPDGPDKEYICIGVKAMNSFMPPTTLSLKGPGGGGWILMNAYQQVITRSGEIWGQGKLFAVGDCNYSCIGDPPWNIGVPPFPKTWPAARKTAEIAALNIKAQEGKRTMEKLDWPVEAGSFSISLGIDDAALVAGCTHQKNSGYLVGSGQTAVVATHAVDSKEHILGLMCVETLAQCGYQIGHYTGVKKYIEGDFAGAIKDLDSIDSSTFPIELRASAKLQLGHIDEARRDFRRALELNPDSTFAMSNMARTELLDGLKTEPLGASDGLLSGLVGGIAATFGRPGGVPNVQSPEDRLKSRAQCWTETLQRACEVFSTAIVLQLRAVTSGPDDLAITCESISGDIVGVLSVPSRSDAAQLPGLIKSSLGEAYAGQVRLLLPDGNLVRDVIRHEPNANILQLFGIDSPE